MHFLGRLDIFLEVAKLQSFSQAAKALHMTGPAISKQIAALEEELGVRLFHRTTRMVTLTDEGTAYYERTRTAMEEIKEAAEQLRDMRSTPKGTLRINAPLSFGHMHLLPALSGFAKRYPDIKLDVSLDDRQVDVWADGYDMVIRIGALSDSTLVSKMLADCPIHPVASPEYLARHGMPETPRDLKRHRLISYAYHGGAGEWRYKDMRGKTGSVRMEGAFQANTAEMMLQAALDGVGIAVLPFFSVAVPLQAGQLMPVLSGYETHPPRYITALMPPNRYRAAKVKLLADWIQSACKAMPLTP